MQEAQHEATRLTMQLDRTGNAGKAAFGQRMLSNIGAMTSGMVSLGAAVALANQALREQKQLVDEAAERSKQARKGIAPLAQLAATSAKTPAGRKKKFLEFEQEAKEFYAAGATDSEAAAGYDVFGLRSAGLSRKDRDFARSVQASGALQNIGEAGVAYAAIQTTLGEGAPKRFEDFLDQAIQASAIAPSQAPEIPQAAARSAGSAAALGYGNEFLNASTAYLAKATGSASQGGTQLAALLKGVESVGIQADPSLKGLTGVQLIQELKRRNLDRGGLAKLLGNDNEAITGARTLMNVSDELAQSVEAIKLADQQDLARQTIALPDSSRGLRAARLASRATAGRELAEQNGSSELANLVAAGYEERRANRARGTEREWGDYFGDQWAGNTRILMMGDAARRAELFRMVAMHETGRNPLPEDLAEEFRAAIREQTSELKGAMTDTGRGGRQE